MSAAELLAVVEVDFADRVTCRAPGCGHSVYKRIHVVRVSGTLTVLGSDCYARLHGHSARSAAPRFGTSEGHKLSDEERALLLSNTEAFVARMEEEHAAREAERERQAQEEAMLRARAEQARADEAAAKQAHLEAMRARPGAADTPAMRAALAQIARRRQQQEDLQRTRATHGAHHQSPNQSGGYSSARPARSTGWEARGAAGNPFEGYSPEVLHAAEAKARADLRATGIDVDNPALRYLVEGRMVMDLRGQKPRAR